MEDYYKSAAWRDKRRQRLEHDKHTCQGCGITADHLDQLGWPALQVHHKNAGPPDYRYPSFGFEQLSDLLTLCSLCHDGITNSVRHQRFKLDPKKRVKHEPLQPPSLQTPSRSKRHDITHDCSDQNFGREPIAVPQRSDSRSAKYLRESHESRKQ